MRFLEFRIVRRYLSKLPKGLLIAVALVFVSAQTLVLLATSLPLDPSQRADKFVGVRQYAFTSGAGGVSVLGIGTRVSEALGLAPQAYSESFFGELYLSGVGLRTNFSEDAIEWQNSVESLDYSENKIDGFLYTEAAKSNNLILTSIVGANAKADLRLLEVPGRFNRLVLKPGTFRAQRWNEQGILPATSINLNFDSTLSQTDLVNKISALFPDGSFSQAQEPYGCISISCLIDRDYVIEQGRGNYLTNLLTPYLVAILLALLPILIRGGKELRLESNKFTELGVKRFKGPKLSTFRFLTALVLTINGFSLFGVGLGFTVYQIFKWQAPSDFGSLLVPFDLIFAGFLWSVLAAGTVALAGEKRTNTFTSNSMVKNLSTTTWVLSILSIGSALNVLALSANPAAFAPFATAESQWEGIVAIGFLLVGLISLVSLRVRVKSKRKLFQTALGRKYPLMSLMMIGSLFATSLLAGVGLPALALGDRFASASAPVTFPKGFFSVPTYGGYSESLRANAEDISSFSVPKQADIVTSSVPFASGSGNFFVFPKDAARQIWPNLQQELDLETGELFLFQTSVDKVRTVPEVVSFQLGDKKVEYLAHFLNADDAWGSSYTGVFIDGVPEAFSTLFSGEERFVLMQTDLDRDSINAALLAAGLDPAQASFWYVPGESQVKYRLALFLVFSLLLGLLMSFFVVRAVNATLKREASLISSLGYSAKEIQRTIRGMLLKNFGIAMSLGMYGLAFYFAMSNAAVDTILEEVLMGVGAFFFASLTGLIPIVFAGRIPLQLEEESR